MTSLENDIVQLQSGLLEDPGDFCSSGEIPPLLMVVFDDHTIHWREGVASLHSSMGSQHISEGFGIVR